MAYWLFSSFKMLRVFKMADCHAQQGGEVSLLGMRLRLKAEKVIFQAALSFQEPRGS